MTIFLLILGIVLIIVGVILACVDDYDNEDLLNPLGWVLAVIGVIMMFWNLFVLCGDDKPKIEVAEVVVTDSTQVQVKPDSIYAIQYVITWKDDNEIKCGSDIILKGKTEKQVGDTITINLK